MRDLRRALRYMPLLGGLAPPPPSPRYPFQPFVAAPLPSNPLPLCPSRALPLAGLAAALRLAAPRRRPIASPRACPSALGRLFAADSSVENSIPSAPACCRRCAMTWVAASSARNGLMALAAGSSSWPSDIGDILPSSDNRWLLLL